MFMIQKYTDNGQGLLSIPSKMMAAPIGFFEVGVGVTYLTRVQPLDQAAYRMIEEILLVSVS